jgi:hypothetical protein
MMVYSTVAIEYPQEHEKPWWIRRTRFWGTCKQSIMTLYYLIINSVYDAALHVHGIFTIHSSFFTSISFQKPTEYCWIYLRLNAARLMCRKSLPKWLAGMICQITCRTQVRLQPADSTCQNSVRFQLAGLTCQRKNSLPPLRIPSQDPARHSPPPLPHPLHVTE